MKATFIGRFGDFGLGSSAGISTDLFTDEHIGAFGRSLGNNIQPVTDTAFLSCIDGRERLHNADGSAPRLRARQVGGTGVLLETFVNGGVISDLDGVTPAEVLQRAHMIIEQQLGILPSAHEGGCGGVNGAVVDNQAIANEPSIMAATNALMALPEILSFTAVAYDEQAAGEIMKRATVTADWLQRHKWSGQDYVDQVKDAYPGGVEVVRTAEDRFNGHKERAFVIVLSSTHTLDLDDVFVMGLGQSLAIAQALAEDCDATVEQYLIANIAKHIAVGNRLPSSQTPIYIFRP